MSVIWDRLRDKETMKPSWSWIIAIFAILAVVIGWFESGDKGLDFDELVAFSKNHRPALAALVSDIQKQPALSRVIWSDREFITVIYRDGRIVDGYADDTKWQTDIRAWIERLKSLGCHGFDDMRSDNGSGSEDMRLYLDIRTYIAVPLADRYLKQYAAWAKAGKNSDGYRCIDLGQGWYLSTEKN